MHALDELALLLRPAGGGVYVVSTGLEEQRVVQRALYGVERDADVVSRFRERLRAIAGARVVVLAIPSDVGAGYLRGANMGPQGIRAALCAHDADWSARCEEEGIVDIGDVFVVPQLLHDDMLAPAQIAASRRALYPDLPESDREGLPVSPLSIAERALDLVAAINPAARPFILGGDHSCAWPAVASIAKREQRPWGIVQPDAHTDLMEERLGVKICFATWSYHANELLGRGGKLVQVGIRATRHARSHWEESLGVRQVWADACLRDPAAALDEILAAVRASGAERVYFSNDIDGTDSAYGDATGTPEAGGLEPEFVVELIRRLGREVGLLGGDIVEVAPPIARTPGGAEKTCALAARYARETLAALCRAE